MNDSNTRVLNEALFDQLCPTPQPESWLLAFVTLRWITARRRYKQKQKWLDEKRLEKTAIDSVNDFTRQRMREQNQRFNRTLQPPLKIANDELDRMADEE